MEKTIYTSVFVCAVIFLTVWSWLLIKIKEKSVLTEVLLILLYLFSSFWLFVSSGVIKLGFIALFLPVFYAVTFLIHKLYNKTRLLKEWSFYVYTLFVAGYVAFITYALLVALAINSIFG